MPAKAPYKEYLAAAFLAALYIGALSTNTYLGTGAVKGWWGWYDQSMYLQPVVSFPETGKLGVWHYQPLYSLFAGVLGWLVEKSPLYRGEAQDAVEAGFYLLNFVCWLVSAALFNEIARKLGIGFGWLIFVATAFLYPPWLESFIIPWTSTLAVPLIFTCYLLVLQKQWTLPRFGVLAACGIAILMTRPSDVFAVMPAGLFFAFNLLRARPKAGLAANAVVAIFGLLCLFGWGYFTGVQPLGPYFRMAANNGMDLASFPYKFVALMLDAKDYGKFGEAIVDHSFALFFLMTGALTVPIVIGIVHRNWPLAAVGVSILVFVVVAFSFNDLGPANLLRYLLTHYFKFMLPLGLLFWIHAARIDMRATAILGVGIAALSFGNLSRTTILQPCSMLEVNKFECIDKPLRGMRIMVNKDAANDVPFGAHKLRVDGRELVYSKDYRLYYDVNMAAAIVFVRPVSGTLYEFALDGGLSVTEIVTAVQTTP